MVSGLPSMWSDLFVPGVSLVEKVLRSLVVFVFLVIALRVGGKRELGQLNILDFAVLLLVSNALQNAMIGADNSLVGGVVGAATLFALNYVFARLTLRSPRARHLLQGTPRILVQNGRVIPEALRREAITLDDLRSVVLERGFERLEDVDLVVLEPNGHLAVMGREAAGRWRDRRADDGGPHRG